MHDTLLLDLIRRDTPLKRTSMHDGGEYSGPCPLCRQGHDRFKVWPAQGRWACLGPEAGRAGCDVGGDAAGYLRQRDGIGYAEACARLGITPSPHGPAASRTPAAEPAVQPPNPTWQARGADWAAECAARLWQPEGAKALAYLRRRGLSDQTIAGAALGYQPHDAHEPRSGWGLPDDEGKPLWLPRGILIPWRVGGSLWRINVRRPLSKRQAQQGQAKYIGPAGFAQGLYGADTLTPGRPAVLVEGEIDALTVTQCAGHLTAAVATGSTCGARRAVWVQRLAQASRVLVAFDVEANGAGEAAAGWWLDALPAAVRWQPLLHDLNAMHVAGLDVAAWVQAGLDR